MIYIKKTKIILVHFKEKYRSIDRLHRSDCVRTEILNNSNILITSPLQQSGEHDFISIIVFVI